MRNIPLLFFLFSQTVFDVFHQTAGSYAEQLVELEAYRVENNICDGVKGLHVYGAKVVQPTGLVVATASKTASTAGGSGT